MRQAIIVSVAFVVLLAVSASAASTSPLKDYFGFFDINKDGRLSDVEITEGVWALENEEPGQLPPQELLELSRHIIIKEIDMDFDGFIDWTEYSLRFARLNDHDAPEQIHLSLGNTTSAMTVTWVTKYVDNGAVAEFWPCGQSSNVQNLTAVTFTYEAGVFGWTGWIHRTQLQKLSAESCYTYRVGSQTSGKLWSPEFSFYTPPVTGTTPAGRPLSIALFGDMGTVMPLGFLVTDQMVADAAKQPQGSFDLFMHAGDISYAGTSASREFEEVWDLWSNQVQPLASVTPYMTAVGNHEKYYNFTSYLSRLDMPFGPTAQRNFYYSYDYGLVHFVSICTETYIYDYAPGTPQYLWIQQDLIKANKNRHNVPWIIVVGHRPMYSSDLSSDSGPLQQYLEPLLYQYKVDIALWGHMHEYERTYPVWNNTVTQYPVGKSSDGLPIFENAPSTIHLTIGTAGAFIFEHFEDPSPSWSAFHAEKYGYGHLQVFNATTLSFGFQSEREKAQVDGFWLQKDPSSPLSRVH